MDRGQGRTRLPLWIGLAGLVAVVALLAVLGWGRLARDGSGEARPGQAAAGGAVAFRGMAFDPPQPAPDFTLTDQRGQPFRLSEQRGNVVLLFFGYTRCPDVCPTTLLHFQRVKEALGSDAGRVRFVFVTVDPARDTQQRLASYLRMYDPSFIGLWGKLETLARVYQAYGVYVEKVPAPNTSVGYWVNHTALVYVIDPKGHLRLAYPFQTPATDMVTDIKRLLREQGGDRGSQAGV